METEIATTKYPGFSQRKITSELDKHLENLALHGYSIMENVLTAERAAQFEKQLGELWLKQEAEFGKERLVELGEHGTHRGLMVEDRAFIEMAANPRVLEVVHKVIGATAILNLQNASAAFPHVQHFQTRFHRDFAKDFVASRPLSLNAFWCITEFTKKNGATMAVPGTHLTEEFPSAEFIQRNTIDLCAPAGSVIFWDSLLLHRTGSNTSDKPRYGINHMYTRPFLKQQIDFPVYLKGLIDEDSALGQLLGFWTIPPKSVKEFRVDPKNRTYRAGQG